MFRTFGLGAGIVTQVLDIAKGSIAALLPYLFLYFFPEQRHWFSEMEVPFQCTLTGLAAVIGHIWPLLYGFKGGKGINSLLGAMLVVDPLACLACALVFILVLLITRYVSLGSILGTATFPLFTYFFNPVVKPSYLLSGVVMFLLILFTHRENMKRLLSGTENKFGSKKK